MKIHLTSMHISSKIKTLLCLPNLESFSANIPFSDSGNMDHASVEIFRLVLVAFQGSAEHAVFGLLVPFRRIPTPGETQVAIYPSVKRYAPETDPDQKSS